MAADSTAEAPAKPSSQKKPGAPRREIPGNLPYLTSPGTLRTILNKVIELAKPDKFNYDFLENVVKMTGGASKSCIPILKRMGFLNSDNSTTELYSRFRTESGRSTAAYEGLRKAFPEMFKRSDYAYSVDDNKLKDIIVEITGLKSNDPVAVAIKGTFNAIKGFMSPGFNHEVIAVEDASAVEADMAGAAQEIAGISAKSSSGLGLSYNINIVIPETSDVRVLNAIFKAVKENLL
jgi:hypothetical protein